LMRGRDAPLSEADRLDGALDRSPEDVVDPLEELSVAKLKPLAEVAVPTTPLTVEPAAEPIA
jgi:hypothetical protein